MGLSLTSLMFETINFVVLVWVLSRLVFRPLKKSIEERKAATTKLQRDAEAKRQEAMRELEQLQKKHTELAELRERVMREAAEDAAETRARLLAEAHEDAAAARAQGQRRLESERQAAEAAVRDLAIEESTRIAAHLLAELSPRALDDALIERLAQAVRTSPPVGHRDGGARRNVTEVGLRFAHAPREGDVEHLRRAFTDVLGAAPEISITEDSALVAGVVATIGHRVLDASIAGNLAVLAERARELIERPSVDG